MRTTREHLESQRLRNPEVQGRKMTGADVADNWTNSEPEALYWRRNSPIKSGFTHAVDGTITMQHHDGYSVRVNWYFGTFQAKGHNYKEDSPVFQFPSNWFCNSVRSE